MVVLRAAIQPMHRSAEVVDDVQLGVAITYAQNPVHARLPTIIQSTSRLAQWTLT